MMMEAVSSLWPNMQFALLRLPHVMRLKTLNDKLVAPKVSLHIKQDSYIVKTADTVEELLQVLSLRFEVFFREFSSQKISLSLFPYDVDRHDFLCDHLIVKEKSSGRVVACYRLLLDSAKQEKPFYTEGEFIIDEFLALPGTKLELGRACVHKEFRKGTVISLLWKGLLLYGKKSHARWMFGCSSITRKDFWNFGEIMSWLKKNGSLVEDFSIGVRAEFSADELNLPGPSLDTATGGKALGSLMHMYILAGAKMAAIPAWDQEMDCLDLFTMIDLTAIPSSFERKFSC